MGRGGVGGERGGGRSRLKEEKKGGGEGRATAKKGGAVVYIATGNRPSYVHQLTSTSQRWWPRGRPTTAGFGGGGGASPWVLLMMGIITVRLESSNVLDEKLRMLEKDVGIWEQTEAN